MTSASQSVPSGNQYFPYTEMCTDEEAEAQVNELSTEIYSFLLMTARIVITIGDSFFDVWETAMGDEDRREAILETPALLHPDLRGITKLVPLRGSEPDEHSFKQYQDTWLVPWMDIETLATNPKVLTRLIYLRVILAGPEHWALFDFEHTLLAQQAGVLKPKYNRQIVDLYVPMGDSTGRQYGDVRYWHRPSVHSRRAFGFKAAMYIMLAQRAIYRTLFSLAYLVFKALELLPKLREECNLADVDVVQAFAATRYPLGGFKPEFFLTRAKWDTTEESVDTDSLPALQEESIHLVGDPVDAVVVGDPFDTIAVQHKVTTPTPWQRYWISQVALAEQMLEICRRDLGCSCGAKRRVEMARREVTLFSSPDWAYQIDGASNVRLYWELCDRLQRDLNKLAELYHGPDEEATAKHYSLLAREVDLLRVEHVAHLRRNLRYMFDMKRDPELPPPWLDPQLLDRDPHLWFIADLGYSEAMAFSLPLSLSLAYHKMVGSPAQSPRHTTVFADNFRFIEMLNEIAIGLARCCLDPFGGDIDSYSVNQTRKKIRERFNKTVNAKVQLVTDLFSNDTNCRPTCCSNASGGVAWSLAPVIAPGRAGKPRAHARALAVQASASEIHPAASSSTLNLLSEQLEDLAVGPSTSIPAPGDSTRSPELESKAESSELEAKTLEGEGSYSIEDQEPAEESVDEPAGELEDKPTKDGQEVDPIFGDPNFDSDNFDFKAWNEQEADAAKRRRGYRSPSPPKSKQLTVKKDTYEFMEQLVGITLRHGTVSKANVELYMCDAGFRCTKVDGSKLKFAPKSPFYKTFWEEKFRKGVNFTFHAPHSKNARNEDLDNLRKTIFDVTGLDDSKTPGEDWMAALTTKELENEKERQWAERRRNGGAGSSCGGSSSGRPSNGSTQAPTTPDEKGKGKDKEKGQSSDASTQASGSTQDSGGSKGKGKAKAG